MDLSTVSTLSGKSLLEEERQRLIAEELARMPNPLFEAWARYPAESGLYLNGWAKIGGNTFPPNFFDRYTPGVRWDPDVMVNRHALCDRYSWAVPSAEAIELIASFSPIVEIGAGRGYWAWLLRHHGARVDAYDLRPPMHYTTNHWHNWSREWFTPIKQGGPIKLWDHPRSTLLMCWPPYEGGLDHALRYYRGDRAIIIGEGAGGCTGGRELEHLLGESYCDEGDCDDHLAQAWELVTELEIPQWYGMHDYLRVYERAS